jgi:RimJ/RimL family protein N-acetyltransferase
MKDPALLEATGSEPLSMEEEVEMQQSWRDDEAKCTFIVHASDRCLEFQKRCLEENETPFCVNDNLGGMVGDVNLFLSEMDEDDGNSEDGEEHGALSVPSAQPRMQAEIDIMIAEKDCQGKGLGKAATCAMALYGLTELNLQRIFCKINEDNVASINLFKSIGFEQCDYAACFKQIELELKKPLQEMKKLFKTHGGSFKKVPCPLTRK